jgi:hypothetical protein
MSWNRKLWGVEFKSYRGGWGLIGAGWHPDYGRGHHGEPSRALLFTTRAAARQFVSQKQAEWRQRSPDDVLSHWRLRVVRVRETVKRIKEKRQWTRMNW